MATGGPTWDGVGALGSEGTLSSDGLTGVRTRVDDVVRGRFAEHSDLGAFRIGDIFDGHTRWKIDRSGGVHPLDADFSRRFVLTDAWLARRDYLRPGAGGAALTEPVARDAGERHYWVLTATPKDAEPVDLWFDAESKRLARVVRQEPIDVSVVRLDDYRPVDGLMLPFRIDDGAVPGQDVTTVRDYRVLRAAPAATFARPAAPADVRLRHASRLPATTASDIIVEALLNGRKFGFILDTGGHDIITPEAAAALGLTPVGHGLSGGAGAGLIGQQDVRVARFVIGAAKLKDQHFFVLPLAHPVVEQDPGPPLGGILGLELLERMILRVDYRAATVTLFPKDEAPGCRGDFVPIRFDDDMPLVDGHLDGARGVIAIDTGNGGSTVVQGVWAKQVGLAAALKTGMETVSFGNGGESHNWVSLDHRVALGGAEVAGAKLRYAEDSQGAFSSRTEAGNAGYEVLANYVVTFDYGHRRMCLERSPGFTPPPLTRTGVVMSRTEPAAFAVVLVRDGSPGAAAGVEKGDKVVSVAGQPVSTLRTTDVAKMLRAPPGTPVAFGLSRDGHPLTVTIVLRDPN